MDHKIIANIMVVISHTVVWPVIQEVCKTKNIKMPYPFQSRVGTGAKTYHSLKRTEGKIQHVVTYGQKMIMDKFDYNRAILWLTGREIIKYKFFNGNVSFENVVAHTILHEMAHALQVIMSDREYNSVHNEAFYKWLGLLHERCGDEVLYELKKRSEEKNVHLDFKTPKNTDRETTEKEIKSSHLKLKELYLCKFDRTDTFLVKLIKINPKSSTITVVEKKSKYLGRVYKVSHSMLLTPTEEDLKNKKTSEDALNIDPYDMSNIKIFKKYKLKIKNNAVVVQVQKKNLKTIKVKIIEGDRFLLGKSFKVSPSYLTEEV